jgi:hypothetical protein
MARTDNNFAKEMKGLILHHNQSAKPMMGGQQEEELDVEEEIASVVDNTSQISKGGTRYIVNIKNQNGLKFYGGHSHSEFNDHPAPFGQRDGDDENLSIGESQKSEFYRNRTHTADMAYGVRGFNEDPNKRGLETMHS